MKKKLLIFACSGSILAAAQNNVNITSQQYNSLKQSNQLDLSKHYRLTDNSSPQHAVHPMNQVMSSRASSTICSCLVPLDSTFTLAMTPNDDGSSSIILLPFSFNYYGVMYDSLYINNNGNISFTSPYPTYTPDSFPSLNFNMIAPFWADVDTRAKGVVFYKITPTALIVKWDSVGYYPSMLDKLNSFQLIITNGADSILPSGDNVAFCYGDMQWTTGSASSGVNGFGGTPATAGVNIGNGSDYFQVGRFDHAGTDFDGPYNNVDGVDFLDNQGMYFNVAAVGNIPPIIINNNICDTIDVYTGDTTRSAGDEFITFKIGVSTPEINQTVNAVLTCTEPGSFTYTTNINTPTYKEYACTFTASHLPESLYYVHVTASDNGTPAMQSNRTIVIKNKFSAALTGIKENKLSSVSIYPNPADGSITVNHNFNTASNPILSVVNVMGQNVMTAQLTIQQQTIDISSLCKGIYFAVISSKEGKSSTIKIVRR